ncbi:hypothetical protein ACJJTC_010276 [Scirpophaga incertulas]
MLREKWSYYAVIIHFIISTVLAYSRTLYKIINETEDKSGIACGGYLQTMPFAGIKSEIKNRIKLPSHFDDVTATNNITFIKTIKPVNRTEKDPLIFYQQIRFKVLFGDTMNFTDNDDDYQTIKAAGTEDNDYLDDDLGHYPTGSAMHAELFQGKSSVHLLPFELIHADHGYLKLTKDYMQTAVDAFSILLSGTTKDVLHMPSAYILRSARTIAMMKIEREKLAATWNVVKADKNPDQISHEVLEMYRPLFKYLNGREMANLNLSDDRILTYIGTHADLNRHQVGVIASKYIKINPRWKEPYYLNQMNNLLCGVPMTVMRRVPFNTYLQLNHQVFYHIRACDPLQRRFYLTIMTKSQALGKSYGWNARDVFRLGLLLSEISGSQIAQINPEAMSGLTAQVILEIPPHVLMSITDMQIRYMSQKALNILAKKLKMYQNEELQSSANSCRFQYGMFILLISKLL